MCVAGASLGIIDDVLRHVGSMSESATFMLAVAVWAVCVGAPLALLERSRA